MADPFRYYDYAPSTRLIGAVGRVDVVENIPGSGETHGRIIADFGHSDDHMAVLQYPGEPFIVSYPHGRKNCFEPLTRAEIAAIRALLRVFNPDRPPK